MSDIQFVPGLIVKAPRENAPDFVKAQVSIKVEELGQFLREQYKAGQEWVNVDIKVAKSGKWYAAVNTYKKEEKPARPGSSKVGRGTIEDDRDLPF